MVKVVSVLLVVFLLATGSPAIAQSSGVVASARRLALTVQPEQDSTVIRRRRSGTIATIGGVLATAGLLLATRQPRCDLVRGDPETSWRGFSGRFGGYQGQRNYEPLWQAGQCDVRVIVRIDWNSGYKEGFVAYLSDERLVPNSDNNNFYDFQGLEAKAGRTLNYVGWAAAATGATMLWLGLSPVDVPFRVDIEPGGGFRAARSFGW